MHNEIFITVLLIYFLHFYTYTTFCFIWGINLYTSTQLKNRNYLLVTNDGVLIYDPSLTIQINKTEIDKNQHIILIIN